MSRREVSDALMASIVAGHAGAWPAAPPQPTQLDPAAGVPAGRDEWLRYALAWHAAMAGLAVATAVLVLLDDAVGPAARSLTLGLLAALVVCYTTLGLRALRRQPEAAGPAYLVVGAPLTIGLFAAAPVASLMPFALYPISGRCCRRAGRSWPPRACRCPARPSRPR